MAGLLCYCVLAIALYILQVNAACIILTDAHGEQYNLDPVQDCHQVYLQHLANYFTQNVQAPGGLFHTGPVGAASDLNNPLDPYQWAAMGFDRRIASRNPATPVGGLVYGPVANSVIRARNQPRSYNNADYVAWGNDNTNQLFWGRAFLWPIALAPNDGNRLGDVGNYQYDNLNIHTERLLRNILWGNAIRFLPDADRHVYVYTYSTPCYAGCRLDVFQGPNSIGAAVRAKQIQQYGAVRPLTEYYLGFDTQYKSSDDLQVWSGFQEYMRWDDGVNILPVDQTNKWRLIPLRGTFQTLMTERLMIDSTFCANCEFNANPVGGDPLYLPRAANGRERAIRYILDTVMYRLQTVRANAWTARWGNVYDRNRDILGNKWISMRDAADWLPEVRKFSADVQVHGWLNTIFTAALTWRADPAQANRVFFNSMRRLPYASKVYVGRILSIGPPSQKPNYFVDLGVASTPAQILAALTPWRVACLNGYTGVVCEIAPVPPARPPLVRGIGYIPDVLPAGWVRPDQINTIPATPGIFLYSSQVAAFRVLPAGPPNALMFIGGSTNLIATIQRLETGRKSGNPAVPISMRDGATRPVYISLPGKTQAEIDSYIVLLQTLYCGVANEPKQGGMVIAANCVQYDDQWKMVPEVFNRLFADRFDPAVVAVAGPPILPQRLVGAAGPNALNPPYAPAASCLVNG